MLNILSFHIRLLQSFHLFKYLGAYFAVLVAAPLLKLDIEIWFMLLLMLPPLTAILPQMALFYRPDSRTTELLLSSLSIAKFRIVVFHYVLLSMAFCSGLLTCWLTARIHSTFLSDTGITIDFNTLLKTNLMLIFIPLVLLMPFVFRQKISYKLFFVIYILMTSNLINIYNRTATFFAAIPIYTIAAAVLLIMTASIYFANRFYHSKEIKC